MKNRHKRYAPKIAHMEERRSLFALTPILLNIIAIVVVICAYAIAMRRNIYPDYQVYIYWTANVLVSYNILVASARSFIAPLVTLLIAGFILITIYSYNGAYLSVNEDWQLLALGIVGFFISYSRLL